jgi:hypothetical protein
MLAWETQLANLYWYGTRWIVSPIIHRRGEAHKSPRTAHQIYKRANNAISDIQANINKAALIERSGFSNPNSVKTETRISELQVATRNYLISLTDLIGGNQKPQIIAPQQGLDRYWNSNPARSQLVAHAAWAAETQTCPNWDFQLVNLDST